MALPLVLAGPIVRRVDTRSASVWIAFSQPAQVTMTVFTGPQQAGATGSALASSPATPTKRFGENLHVAVVTVGGTGVSFAPQVIHSYDLSFTGAFGTSGLQADGLLTNGPTPAPGSPTPRHLALGYVNDRLPSFVPPSATIDGLRLAHASCRKPHGPADDALTFLDEELESSWLDTDERVQQLFLTGDQIYADDVATSLLDMLGELAEEVVGAGERLEVHADTFVNATRANVPVHRRQRLIEDRAGFTSGSAASHLLSFGEFCAMYLAVWSARVWRTLRDGSALATAVPASVPGSVASHLTDFEACAAEHDDVEFPADAVATIDGQKTAVERFRDQVPKVARVLANCATYMVFDDHEVTDDWNINASWLNRVRARPLGRNVVRNGVMAYTVFQAWGNDPARFGGTPADNLNEQLLSQINQGFDGTGQLPTSAMTTSKVNELIGLTGEPGKTAEFHFKVEGPRHLVHVLDTRTRRKLPGIALHPPELLGGSLDKQLPKGGFTDGRELLVVVSPVPVLGPELVDTIGASVARQVADAIWGYKRDRDLVDTDCPPSGSQWGAEKYDAEAWYLDEKGMEALLTRMAEYHRAVILSGDVHYACSVALDHWRKDPANASQTLPPDRIVQLTSSPSSNRFKALVEAVNRDSALPQAFLAGMRPERLAWKGEAKITVPTGEKIYPGRFARMKRSPSLLPARTWPPGTSVDEAPDWRWRSTQLRDERPATQRPSDQAPPPLPGTFSAGTPADSHFAVASMHQAAAVARRDHTRTVVFAPNVGIVEFEETSGTQVVRHVLLSASSSGGGARNTVHEAELDPSGMSVPELVTEA